MGVIPEQRIEIIRFFRACPSDPTGADILRSIEKANQLHWKKQSIIQTSGSNGLNNGYPES